MAKKYFPNTIEGKWQRRWKGDKLFSPDLDKVPNPFYSLMMFPYPSAEGLHVGNMYPFTAVDIFARFKRMHGLDVFEPIGLDGFGIHSENYALQINKHPLELSKITEKRFYEQLTMIGNAYDWDHTVESYKPEYYKWTQWIFLQMYKHGLAYRKKAEVNWCPSCKTVLADEQVVAGLCERCSSLVIKKDLEQWFFKITDYADRLLKNLEWIDWSEKIKVAQRNWIGKSEGTLIKFQDIRNKIQLEVFTTRPDTIFGATFIVVNPEYSLLNKLTTMEQEKQVNAYCEVAKKKSELERKENKDKTGVFTGSHVNNPLTGEDIPVWVADYVLPGYGTGAIMAVPAHDERDFEFARKFDLPIKLVIASEATPKAGGAKQSQTGNQIASSQTPRNDIKQAYTGDGVMANSGEFDGLSSAEAKEKISDYIEEHQLGKRQIHFHLRDWLISRQRYWGPPIPMIYCGKCGIVPVPEEDLPVELPYIEDFRPTGKGVSPLASDPNFVNIKCPKCGGSAKRETDVSDNFLDSAWYFLRYPSTEFTDQPFDKLRTRKWLPVDIYIGGFEHALLHLLYVRFVTMALHDFGFLGFEEPFKKFIANGHILAEGAKMSKSKGNVINPDKYIKEYGADTLRMYLMFMGPISEGGDFRDASVGGIYRFLTRVWELVQSVKIEEATKDELKILHRTIRKVGEDIEQVHFNTAIAGLMILLNFLSKQKTASKETIKVFLLLLAPFAPHITEELWEMIGEEYSIHQQPWPKYEEKYLEEEEARVIVQVNGKVRDQIVIGKDIVSNKEVVEKMALQSPKVQKFLDGRKIKRTMYVPVKIINFVV